MIDIKLGISVPNYNRCETKTFQRCSQLYVLLEIRFMHKHSSFLEHEVQENMDFLSRIQVLIIYFTTLLLGAVLGAMNGVPEYSCKKTCQWRVLRASSCLIL